MILFIIIVFSLTIILVSFINATIDIKFEDIEKTREEIENKKNKEELEKYSDNDIIKIILSEPSVPMREIKNGYMYDPLTNLFKKIIRRIKK